MLFSGYIISTAASINEKSESEVKANFPSMYKLNKVVLYKAVQYRIFKDIFILNEWNISNTYVYKAEQNITVNLFNIIDMHITLSYE